ncbi:MAG: hypothetical protein HYZ54_02055 [Ignavibacteriae bacterium]|nr:hypothetical protein [Ignavibacteriota bacterium]
MTPSDFSVTFSDILEHEFFYHELPEHLKEDFYAQNVSISLNFNFGWHVNDSLFGVKTSIAYRYPSEQGWFQMLAYESSTVYKVDNLLDYLTIMGDKSFDMQEDLLHHILQLTTSTARGILSVKTAGTPLAKIYLPVITTIEFIAPEGAPSEQQVQEEVVVSDALVQVSE